MSKGQKPEAIGIVKSGWVVPDLSFQYLAKDILGEITAGLNSRKPT
jgi:hypothetical protein